ncbi:MFS transporter [Paralcaligenes ureilyticus]|uniref:Putative MFS family arabinose efflux permease n=1 Tax=Paralcaligenes ureilyticus TaxID=627131 RepID=A0A4R3MDR2_9BURK|nr:MFS transporter [Paralcaligenes ureilyticus]TCT10237.1 putative MFS family arabinose efflux permease [Paralcaligenes ureilyticus]
MNRASRVETTVPPSRRYWYLVILALCGFVTSFGAHIVVTNLPAYAQVVGVGAFMIGLLIAVYDFAELFAKPAAGFIADRRGMKAMLLTGIMVFIAGSLLFLVIDPKFLLGVRFIQGLGAAALSTVSITLVAKYFATGRGTAFGIYNAIKGAGYVIAPALGGFLVQGYGFSMIFIVSAAVGIVALLLSLFLPKDRTKADALEDDDDDMSLKEFFLIFKEPHLLPVYAVIVINMFMVGILFGFLPVYLYSIGYTPLQSGILVTVATASYLLVQPLAGYLADKVSIRKTVLAGLLMAALAISVVAFTSGILLILVIVIAGVGVGTVWTNADTLISTMVDQRALGASMGAAQSFKEFGDMAGPLLVGLITQFFGVRVGFVTCGTVALLLLIFLARSTSFQNNK